MFAVVGGGVYLGYVYGGHHGDGGYDGAHGEDNDASLALRASLAPSGDVGTWRCMYALRHEIRMHLYGSGLRDRFRAEWLVPG